MCNACFSLELQIKDPETSPELRQELQEARVYHLNDAIRTRKYINKMIKEVREANSDAPFAEEPLFIPMCMSNPFGWLNRLFLVGVKEGTLGRTEDGNDEIPEDLDMDMDLDEADVAARSYRNTVLYWCQTA